MFFRHQWRGYLLGAEVRDRSGEEFRATVHRRRRRRYGRRRYGSLSEASGAKFV